MARGAQPDERQADLFGVPPPPGPCRRRPAAASRRREFLLVRRRRSQPVSPNALRRPTSTSSWRRSPTMPSPTSRSPVPVSSGDASPAPTAGADHQRAASAAAARSNAPARFSRSNGPLHPTRKPGNGQSGQIRETAGRTRRPWSASGAKRPPRRPLASRDRRRCSDTVRAEGARTAFRFGSPGGRIETAFACPRPPERP